MSFESLLYLKDVIRISLEKSIDMQELMESFEMTKYFRTKRTYILIIHQTRAVDKGRKK